MKRLLVLLISLVLTVSVYADQHGFDTLTGGATSALDGIAEADITDGDIASGQNSGTWYSYVYDASSATAESSPDVIAPDDVGGNGRWLLTGASDKDVLYIDVANDRVGMGTTTPATDLHIYEPTGSAVLRIESGSVTGIMQIQTFNDSSKEMSMGKLGSALDFFGVGSGAVLNREGNMNIISDSNDPIIFYTDTGDTQNLSATEKMRLSAAGDLDLAVGTLPADDVGMGLIGTPTYDDVRDWMNTTQAAGIISGGVISDGGSGTIDITAVLGVVKTTNSAVGVNQFFDLGAATGSSLTDNDTNYIAVDYNSGTPQFITTLSDTSNGRTIFAVGIVYREGTTIDIIDSGTRIDEAMKRIQQHHLEEAALHFTSGATVSETGTLNIAISAGVLYAGVNRSTTDAIDTSVADDFEYYYYNGAAWIESDETDIDNLQYNNPASGLVTLTNNRYGVHWVYKGTNSTSFVVYGQGDYLLAEAQAAQPPSSLPDHVNNFGVRRAKIIVQKSASVYTEIESATDTVFTSASPSNHNELGLIDGGTAGEYYHLTSAQHTLYGTPEGSAVLSTGESGGTKYLREDGDGTSSWQTVAGGGDVTKVGTPADSQVGVWTGDGTIEGASSFTYDGSNLQLTGDIGSTGTKITKGWFTDLEVTNGATFGSSADPTITLSDSNDAAGTGKIFANSGGGTNDIVLTLGVEDPTGEGTPYIDLSGDTETIDLLKPTSFKSLTPVTDDADNFAANFTGINLYGGTFIANAAGTAQLPAIAEGMNFTIITLGAVAVVVEPNASDSFLLDGVQLDDADSATNLSTAGDISVYQYYSAAGWVVTSNDWTDED